MKPLTVAIIQARNGSTRLPGKVMRCVNERPMVIWVVDRVRAATLVDEVVVATTVDAQDDAMAEMLSDSGVRVLRGSTHDVLDRYYVAARQVSVENIVRITADCPLIDARVIDDVVGLFLKSGSDYTCNIMSRTYPDGQDVEVFSFGSLERAWQEAKTPREREHVTIYFREHPEFFKISNLKYEHEWGHMRWTLDYAEDFAMIEEVFRAFKGRELEVSMEEIAAFLQKNPQVCALNRKYAVQG
ncbi:MAG: glycosyltransferase family protein [Candidatus Omnitrophota bacterium]|nr:glycosyltransferase family protein [Candidatus Omnitrophota bacterium]